MIAFELSRISHYSNADPPLLLVLLLFTDGMCVSRPFSFVRSDLVLPVV